ncbi:potassium-transporting ATPase subunit KdpC [Deefgea tanakiae]|uniref:Potassium-transporting ATPase KdpC subunit n=1 Tax=Deefgea tanakiae TaxID=2865840 RepID=A0ABX8Z660_9NEIS|nr:potassium-transporting ATPase subunit KdpC [Deefgea tanakiae]
MLQQLRPALVIFTALTLITGVAYPLAVTGIAKVFFPQQAAGSLIEQNGKVVGSSLIGQSFSDTKYFWSRPSATGPMAYNGSASSGSNLGPTNPVLLKAVSDRVAAMKAAHPAQSNPVPLDLVTTSASGLDPHISPAAASYQLERVANARKLSPTQVAQLVSEHTAGKQWGILGEPVVNVLELNLALDRLPAAK